MVRDAQNVRIPLLAELRSSLVPVWTRRNRSLAVRSTDFFRRLPEQLAGAIAEPSPCDRQPRVTTCRDKGGLTNCPDSLCDHAGNMLAREMRAVAIHGILRIRS